MTVFFEHIINLHLNYIRLHLIYSRLHVLPDYMAERTGGGQFAYPVPIYNECDPYVVVCICIARPSYFKNCSLPVSDVALQ